MWVIGSLLPARRAVTAEAPTFPFHALLPPPLLESSVKFSCHLLAMLPEKRMELLHSTGCTARLDPVIDFRTLFLYSLSTTNPWALARFVAVSNLKRVWLWKSSLN